MINLNHDERLRLMKFVCSFAWTDLEVADTERRVIEQMAQHSDFNDADRAQILKWLAVPPRPEEVDPTQIPLEHRQRFLDAVRSIVHADGHVTSSESDLLATFEELVRTAH